MSGEFAPGKDDSLQFTFLSTLVSGITYGLVISLYISCFRTLLKTQHLKSKIRRRFLFAYITFLLSLSTWAFVQQAFSITAEVFRPPFNRPSSPLFSSWLSLTESNPWFLPPAIWAADGFMVWRCFALYQGISRRSHIFLVSLLVLLILMSLVAGLFVLVPVDIVGLGPAITLGLSAISNIVLAALIVFRLLYHQRYLRKTLGHSHGSLYTRIMVMCVESSSLIVVFTVLYIVLYFEPSSVGYDLPLFLLPHICVISPLLIVYRVAHGTEAKTTVWRADVDNLTGDGQRGNIRFISECSTSIGQGEREAT
ncbi:hypothetical protein GALMADRAFT_227737 [Galerina marginata CBS 339.88]|uniref:G-protein coupled receptors family 1 profile domain-containing protein n=1 Tax=Galerina marginata (strain CBS 339.88) TaxID=685588 RepID=A0A067ST37_GALM3|nr:hypothetical protein GALMADRAFT_227737 [Galerina marginata CBS 339.88]